MAKKDPVTLDANHAPDSKEFAAAAEVLPSELLILPLSGRPFFPLQSMPLLLDVDPWRDTIERIGDSPHYIARLVMTKRTTDEIPRREDFHSIGCAIRVHRPMQKADKIQFIAEGQLRFCILKWLSDVPPYRVMVEYPPEEQPADIQELKAYAMAIINAIKELLPLNPLYSEELRFFLERFGPNDPFPPGQSHEFYIQSNTLAR